MNCALALVALATLWVAQLRGLKEQQSGFSPLEVLASLVFFGLWWFNGVWEEYSKLISKLNVGDCLRKDVKKLVKYNKVVIY